MNPNSLAKMCTDFVDSLLANAKRHTLCLNIASDAISAETVVAEHLKTKGVQPVSLHHEPSTKDFGEILAKLAGVTIVTFDDFDHHPKSMDLLLEHVQNPASTGKLVIVSRAWNADNTKKELELRKHCLFYQQNLEKKDKHRS